VKVKPMLGDWEVARIASIATTEQRRLVELPMPGRQGSNFQDLSGEPTHIVIQGSVHGDVERDDFLKQVREPYAKGDPVTFVADIVAQTEVQYVVIESLWFRERGDRPDDMEYAMVLRESPPPPPPPDPLGGLDTSLLEEAARVMGSVSGALDAISALGNIPDLGDPTAKLGGVLDELGGATGDLPSKLSSLSSLFGGGGG